MSGKAKSDYLANHQTTKRKAQIPVDIEWLFKTYLRLLEQLRHSRRQPTKTSGVFRWICHVWVIWLR